MISSRFVRNIMDYLFEEFPEEEIPIAKQQLNCLTDVFYYYYRKKLIVEFDYLPDIHNYKIIRSYPFFFVDGVTLESPDLKHGAAALVHFYEGIVSYFEIWSYDGGYPLGEPANYELIKGRPINEIYVTREK